jgi:hypothetical protein
MSEPNHTADVRVNCSIGHVSVYLDGDHPVETPFLFEQPRKHLAPAAAASLFSHVTLALMIVLLMRYGSKHMIHAPVLTDEANANIVWLSQPGRGGGGGGGNRMKEPPRAAELPGKDKSWSLSSSLRTRRCKRRRRNRIRSSN